MISLRHLLIVAFLSAAGALPVAAQDAASAARELRGLLDDYATQIDAQESAAAVPGSEAEARAQLADVQAQLASERARQTETRASADAARAAILSILPPLPVQVVQPAPPGPNPMQPTPPQPGPVQPVDYSALADPYMGGDRRVLTLPGAQMISVRSDVGAYELPVFSILYEFGSRDMGGRTMLAVGRSADRQEGWVDRDQTEDWRSMLVLQYAPIGERQPVVFWKDTDPLEEILLSHFSGPAEAQDLYADIAADTFDRSAVVAIEPERPVDADTRPYFMPIIDHRMESFDDIDGTETLLLELAMVNLQSSARETEATGQALSDGARAGDAEALERLRTGIVFVVDATRSMGPYIEGVQNFVRSVRAGTMAGGFADRVGFGLIGYRDNTASDANIGYRTNTFLPLSTDVDPVEFDAALNRIAPSPVSTVDWREDALAGLEDALKQTDWSDYDARYVILVTDAGPRVIGDAMARDASLGPRSIGRLAERQNVSLSIVHMLTREGQEDHNPARVAYAELARARGAQMPAYFAVTGNGPAEFRRQLAGLGQQLSQSLEGLSQGEALIPEDATLAFASDTFRALEGLDGMPVVIDEDSDEDTLASGIVGELFRFQQEYLGELDGGEAPDFYRAWVADRDLVDPRRRSLDVKVLITRDQLGNLTARLKDLVSRLDRRETGLRDAFEAIVDVSGRTAFDPRAAVGAALMPDYIADLPYKSRFLSMEMDEWAGLGGQQQTEILSTVRDRIKLFEEIAMTEAGWLDLPGRDGGLAVYPLALDDLP